MKGIIVVSQFWTRFFSFGRAVAITIYPFVFVCNSSLIHDRILLNHERVHLVQAIQLLVIPFYVWYLVEFLIRYIQYRNFGLAYYNISFEKEAFCHEADLNYLKKRPFWRFLHYM